MAGASEDKLSKAGNTCDNSYHPSSGFSVEERVLKLIDESEIELAPYEIAKKAHAKRSSVRVILRKLLDRGLILQPYPGAYCNKITYGMRFVPRACTMLVCGFFLERWLIGRRTSLWAG